MKGTEDLKGKFVIAFDTVIDGWDSTKDEDGNVILYNSKEEAFKEMFEDSLSMLQNRTEEELEEYNEDVPIDLIQEMNRTHESGDIKAMEEFWEEHPEMNELGEWIEPAETFIQGRKLIFTEEGFKIIGNEK